MGFVFFVLVDFRYSRRLERGAREWVVFFMFILVVVKIVFFRLYF